jgi:hypothetical protein
MMSRDGETRSNTRHDAFVGLGLGWLGLLVWFRYIPVRRLLYAITHDDHHTLQSTWWNTLHIATRYLRQVYQPQRRRTPPSLTLPRRDGGEDSNTRFLFFYVAVSWNYNDSTTIGRALVPLKCLWELDQY